MTGIYKITNTITNQCYIGQSVDIETRWKQHVYESKKLHEKSKFYLALNQYGVEAFEFEILEECPLEQEILDERERYWIEYYDSYNNGYNSTLGGQFKNSWMYDPQIIRDLWDDGYSVREIVEIVGCGTTLVRDRLKGYKDYNAHTSHSRGKLYAIAKDGQNGTIAVYQYDLNGQYIAEYKSLHEAARALGHNTISSIIDVFNHKSQTAYGYQWSKEKVDFMSAVPIPHGKTVRCMNTGQFFHSTGEAAEWCNLKSSSSISMCCTGKRKTAGKHPETGEPLKWEYIK